MSRAATPPQGAVLADLLPRSLAIDIGQVAGFVVLLTLSARIIIPLPFTPVPVTAQTLVVLGGAVALGATRATVGAAIYLLAGVGGVPLLASGGATLGYVVGFVVAAACVGRIADRRRARTVIGVAATMVLGNLIVYAIGVPYLAHAAGLSLGAAVGAGVVPFLLGDLAKIALASALVPTAWNLLGRSPGAGE